jgi:hypothetical protein
MRALAASARACGARETIHQPSPLYYSRRVLRVLLHVLLRARFSAQTFSAHN